MSVSVGLQNDRNKITAHSTMPSIAAYLYYTPDPHPFPSVETVPTTTKDKNFRGKLLIAFKCSVRRRKKDR